MNETVFHNNLNAVEGLLKILAYHAHYYAYHNTVKLQEGQGWNQLIGKYKELPDGHASLSKFQSDPEVQKTFQDIMYVFQMACALEPNECTKYHVWKLCNHLQSMNIKIGIYDDEHIDLEMTTKFPDHKTFHPIADPSISEMTGGNLRPQTVGQVGSLSVR